MAESLAVVKNEIPEEAVDEVEAAESEARQATQLPEEVGSIVGYVLSVGPDAYSDPKRFPSGPFCKEGDWVVMRSYSGTRFLAHGREFRLINDDSVEAVVEDPRGIVKV